MNKQTGFTVLEAIIATAVAGVVLLGISIMINSLNVINDRARDLTLANALAENKIEALRSAGFLSLSDGTYDFSAELPSSLSEPRTATYTIADAAPGGTTLSNLKQIDIVITYRDYGSNRTINHRSYIGELGIGQY